MSRVYIASSWRNHEEVRTIANLLRVWGHEVFDFTDPDRRPEHFDKFSFNSTVFDASELGPREEVDWIEFLEAEQTKRAYNADKAGLDWADTVVLILPAGRSAHLEAGYAAGAGKRLVIFGELPRGEFDVMYLLADRCLRRSTQGLRELRDALREQDDYGWDKPCPICGATDLERVSLLTEPVHRMKRCQHCCWVGPVIKVNGKGRRIQEVF